MPTPHDRRLVAALLTAALALLLAGCASPGAQESQPAPSASQDEAIATVNGRAIPLKIYEMFVRNGREALGIDEGKEEGRRKLAELREGVVSELIDRAVISHEAERRGLRVTPEMLSERERREIEKLGGESRSSAPARRFGLGPPTGRNENSTSSSLPAGRGRVKTRGAIFLRKIAPLFFFGRLKFFSTPAG